MIRTWIARTRPLVRRYPAVSIIELAIWFAVAAVVSYTARYGYTYIYTSRIHSIVARTTMIARLVGGAQDAQKVEQEVIQQLKYQGYNRSDKNIDPQYGAEFSLRHDVDTDTWWVVVRAQNSGQGHMIYSALEDIKTPADVLDEVGIEEQDGLCTIKYRIKKG